ncbi:MAG: 16S rRNA processing protein RimM [Acidobacteriaceae bacterium]|nr:16S rRNA processing protein RimM [Acidobacteriaceae bacterium]MBV9781766.1 16S rRNA processing protein RimM [Acidobacteriaceae bacterium]
MEPNRVIIAEVLRPRGNRGELLAKSQTDVPGRLETLRRAHARLTDGSEASVEIIKAWTHKGQWVLRLAGVDSINSAERFRGAEIWVPLSGRAPLPEGEFFESDLIGCQVTDGASGKLLGPIEAFENYGGPPLMEIRVDGREVLIPFVPSICRNIDLAARSIIVDLPGGILDL